MTRKQFVTADPPVDSKHVSEFLARELTRFAGEITWDPDNYRVREISATVTMVLVLDDLLGGLVKGNNSITSAFVIDPTSAVAWPIGAKIDLVQWGAGLCQVSGSGAATIVSRGSLTNLNGQYAKVRLIHAETDVWLLSGDRA